MRNVWMMIDSAHHGEKICTKVHRYKQTPLIGRPPTCVGCISRLFCGHYRAMVSRAKNPSQMWASGAEGVSGATGYRRSLRPPVADFAFWVESSRTR